jgi:hypothetical protein
MQQLKEQLTGILLEVTDKMFGECMGLGEWLLLVLLLLLLLLLFERMLLLCCALCSALPHRLCCF